MKKTLVIISFIVVGMSLVTGSATAVTVMMQFNGNGSYSYNYPTYPYYLTVNGTPDTLMCISYNEHITYGETWEANIRVFAPIDGTQSWAGEPVQVFLGTPEPSSLLLLGTGLIGAVGVVRRKINL